MRALLLVALALAAGGSSTQSARTLPTAIAFWTSSRGVAIVAGGEGAGKPHWLARTADGGKTWSNVRSTSADDVDVAPPRSAWAAVDSGVLRSTDGGRSWRRVSSTPIRRLSFATSAAGLGLRGLQVMGSNDGGARWTPLARPCPRSAVYAYVSLATPSRGWLLCLSQPGAGQQSKALLATRDGGHTWKRVFAERMSPGYPLGIDFVGASRGWLWERRGGFATTGDGGHSWSALAVGRPEEVEAESTSFFSARDGFALLHDVRRRPLSLELVRTADGGGTWKPVRTWRVMLWPQ